MGVIYAIILIAFVVLVLRAKYGNKTGLGSATCRHCGSAATPGRQICPSCGRNRTVINPKRSWRR